MTKLSRFAVWALVIALYISTSQVGLRHILLPDDARATDSEICAIILLVLLWVDDLFKEYRK